MSDSPLWLRIGGLVAGLALMMVLPFYADATLMLAGLTVMSTAIGAIGLNMLTGATGQLSLGHAFFLAVGAYGYVYFASEPDPAKHLTGLGLPTTVALVLAVLLAGAVGGLFSPISGRLKGTYLGIATLALIFIGHHILVNAKPVTGGTIGRDVPPLDLGFVVLDNTSELVVANVPFGSHERLWYFVLLLLVLSAWIARGVLRGRPGRALNTIRDHEIAAGVMGVPVARYRAAVFVLSSMYAGLAGAIIALIFANISPEHFGVILALEYLAIIVIGGLGTVAGAIIGATFIGLLTPMLTRYSADLPLVSETSGTGGIGAGEAARIIYGAALVAVVLFLPGGLFGLWIRLRTAVSGRRRTA